jgi:cation diffusion facilitator CzcD-associated flavoprotein CzcO
VLIVGAGLSGIGAASHLQDKCPGTSYAILEARDAIGGTWDLFRYPGIRSDSDMYTMGYSFKTYDDSQAIADGSAILSYIRETARERGIDRKIHFGHRVVRGEWSSEDAQWTVTAERTHTGERVRVTCNFVWACTGYYRYDEGYTPEFEGTERFKGQIVHPQHWPEDLDYEGKRVVVIGSGATAVTLIPSMSDKTEHVTMLQRSPTYIVALPGEDPIARMAQRLLPSRAAYAFLRWKNVMIMTAFYRLSRRWPELTKRVLRRIVKNQLPAGYDVDTHFNPRYNPWDQRVCLVPDGDLFDAISSGEASIETDRIETFTENGLRLESGRELEADIVVTATGLNLLMVGGMSVAVDGEEIDISKTVGYKGMMYSGVPNAAVAFGYTNASWMLKIDLCAEYFCRLLNHMDQHGYTVATPRAPDPSVETEPFVELTSGYVQRAIDDMPREVSRQPWRLHKNYPRDILMLRHGGLEDEGIEFSTSGQRSAVAA